MSIRTKVKNFLLPIICKTILVPKTDLTNALNVKQINCSKQEITLLTHTSNNIFFIKTSTERLYFRECKIHKEIHQYVMDDIDFYYTWICPNLQDDKQFVINALSNKQNFKKFVRMGIVNDTTSGAYKFCMGMGGTHVGLAGATGSQEERLKEFVQFVWGDLFSYTLNRGVKKGKYQTYNATRSIATRRIAELLKLQCLIPKTEYAWLCIDNETRIFGTVMEQALGVCMERMSSKYRQEISSPALQRALSNLNLLDVICLEKDHRVGNYNVVLMNEQALSVVAFDNDSPKSFGIGGISFMTYAGCSPWAINGHINRPYVDKELANNIINIDEKCVWHEMKDLLNIFQLLSLRNRIKKTKKILSSMPNDKLLSEEQWCIDTIKKEVSGDYGDTYFVKFLQDQVIAYQPWIKNR